MTSTAVANAICKRSGWSLVAHVGEGAFKDTFHVRIGTTSRALKIYKQKPTERSKREIDAMKRCDHPNVAKFFALESIEMGVSTFYYLVEEFLPGGTLTSRIGHLTPRAIAEIARTLSGALEHLAGHNLVHRDFKPDNIMFRDTTTAQPVVVDFGLVRDLSASSLTATWAMRGPGSPFFAAPEQLNNVKEMIKPATDQFGLGVTLWFALEQRHPYAAPGDDESTAVQRVADWQLPSSDFVACTDSRNVRPLARMVRPYPVERFRTATDLITSWTEVLKR